LLRFELFENQAMVEYYKMYFSKLDEILKPNDDVVVSKIDHEEETYAISEINLILIKVLLYYV
jgi:hypothetical protein